MPRQRDSNGKAGHNNKNQQNGSLNNNNNNNNNHHNSKSTANYDDVHSSSALSTSGSSSSNLNSQHANTTSMSVNRKQSARDKEREQREREKIVIWRRPVQTIKYCFLECGALLHYYGQKLMQHKILLSIFMALVGVFAAAFHIPGSHQPYIDLIRLNLWFITYWVGLGVLSSVGLGTGLHTFLLYLGPHIASVTLAAYECNSLDFPAPPYPDDIICPDRVDPKFIPSLWNIMSKVRFEAFLWGAGTALGELPPYFMARAARLSGRNPDDGDDMENIEELKKRRASGEKLSVLERGKLFMETLVERVGFFGILACASIPNPLFDLAGITCGHFLVPFWTFFGATLIGKAVIKMHIQKVFVVIAFNETLIEKAIDMLTNIPLVGRMLQEPFKTFLQNQKTHLHRGRGKGAKGGAAGGSNLLARIFEKFVIAMVAYFVVSIINSLAQSYHKRLHKQKAAAGGNVFKVWTKTGGHRKMARD